jgi:glycosyltransferase involved in cell wall biosynthesis
MRVTHISIIHNPLDTRIFWKQSRALAAAGYEVHLVVPAPPAAELDGVRLHGVSEDIVRPIARRQWARQLRAVRHAWRLRPSTFHLHDPHLIPLGLALKLAGARVVYDVHEDYPAHARSKLAGRPVRAALKAGTWRAVERVARHAFDRFVCTSVSVGRRFPPARTAIVRNLPVQADFDRAAAANGFRPYGERPNVVVLTGNLQRIRGIWELAQALELLPAELDCTVRTIGYFQPPELHEQLRRRPAAHRLDHAGWRPYPEIVRELTGARAGLSLLHPLPNHQDPLRSNKLFEYMAAGIPVIASDLPEWRRLVEALGCGLVVDPRDPAAIAGAIERLLRDPAEAEAMGARGRAAVADGLNWEGDRQALLALYRELAGAHAPAPRAPRRPAEPQPESP